MDTRELPVLTNEDRDLIERLAIGLGDDTARVLAYLLRRSEMEGFEDDPATRLAVRIGTSLNRETVADALHHLEERDLVATTTLSTDGYGRPPTAWHAPESSETTVRRIDERHATALLEQARTVAAELGADPVAEANPCNDHTAPEPLRLGLNWSPNPLHAPFFAAASTGRYEANGLDVAIDHHWGSGRALDSLGAGTTDVALAGAATTIRAREAGKPILPVALLFQRAMAVLYTTRESFGGRFETIEQLRGRRVGMSATSETGVLGRLFLSQAGVLDDVTVVDIAGEERAALRSGRAAVVTGSFADPQQMVTGGHTVDSLLVADQFPMYGPALVTTERMLREHQPALRRFLAGTVTGWAMALEDPEAAIRAVARDDPADESALDDEQGNFERAVSEFGTGNAVAKHGWGWHRAAGWERLTTALDQTGLLAASALSESA